MAFTASERNAVATLTTQELTEKVVIANQQCTSWNRTADDIEDNEDLGWVGYIPIVAGVQAISGISDELIAARETRDEWCDRLTFYSAEVAKRRKSDPTTTAAAEKQVLEEQAQVRADVAARSKATLEAGKERTELMGSKTALGAPVASAVETVTGWPERIKEGAFSTFGLGKDQPGSERAVGLARLGLAALAIYAVYGVGASVLKGGAKMAEAGAVRTADLTTKLMDTNLPASAFK